MSVDYFTLKNIRNWNALFEFEQPRLVKITHGAMVVRSSFNRIIILARVKFGIFYSNVGLYFTQYGTEL